MNKLLFILLLSTLESVIAQKYFTRNGFTELKASTEAFEPIHATNNSSSAIVTNEGKIASQIFIGAFKFKIALMQEHFNENYMESSTYPKATFKGIIVGFDFSNLTNNKEIKLKGVLTVRGIDKEIESIGVISKTSNSSFRLKANFKVTPQDFKIKIPSVVRKKIAKEVIINIDYELKEKK